MRQEGQRLHATGQTKEKCNMNLEHIKKIIDSQPTMISALGIEFISTPEADKCTATMPVDSRTCQPYGILDGGASLALAENLAGAGSQALCPDCRCMGISVSGQHLKSAKVGTTVTAVARLIHKGRTLHNWTVTITDEQGDVVSTVSVTNFIKHPDTGTNAR